MPQITIPVNVSNHKMKHVLIISALLLIIGLVIFKYTYTNRTDYILIPNDSTALIIDDWNGIRKVKSLFNLNYHFYDCCSKTGDILYFIRTPKNYSIVARETDNLYLYNNSKIDEYLSRLKFEAKNSPNYYIYSISIPLNYDFDSVIGVLQHDNFKVLLPFDFEKQLPYLKVKYQENNIQMDMSYSLMEQIQDSLKLMLQDYSLTDIHGSADAQGTVKTNLFTFNYDLIFQDNDMLNSAMILLNDSGYEIVEISLIGQRKLWLLDKESNLAEIKNQLLPKYRFILDIKYK
jgi:hypothetical protein